MTPNKTLNKVRIFLPYNLAWNSIWKPLNIMKHHISILLISKSEKAILNSVSGVNYYFVVCMELCNVYDIFRNCIYWTKVKTLRLQYFIFCEKVLDKKYLLKLNNVSQTSSKQFVETPPICLFWCLSYVLLYVLRFIPWVLHLRICKK